MKNLKQIILEAMTADEVKQSLPRTIYSDSQTRERVKVMNRAMAGVGAAAGALLGGPPGFALGVVAGGLGSKALTAVAGRVSNAISPVGYDLGLEHGYTGKDPTQRDSKYLSGHQTGVEWRSHDEFGHALGDPSLPTMERIRDGHGKAQKAVHEYKMNFLTPHLKDRTGDSNDHDKGLRAGWAGTDKPPFHSNDNLESMHSKIDGFKKGQELRQAFKDKHKKEHWNLDYNDLK